VTPALREGVGVTAVCASHGAFPTDNPRPQLTTWTLSKFSNGTVFDNQMLSASFGVLP
jgi:hypothetical protein